VAGTFWFLGLVGTTKSTQVMNTAVETRSDCQLLQLRAKATQGSLRAETTVA
jgi:hypothetical protein